MFYSVLPSASPLQQVINVSKYAQDLPLDESITSGAKHVVDITDSSQWRCEESGLTEGLWLNLSDGHIGSGRRESSSCPSSSLLPFPFLSPSFFLPFSFLPPFLLFHPCPLTSSADSFSLSLFLSFPAGNWDGSGGTGAAKTHYEQLLRDTGKNYPLVVKLGTITPDGKGDVYSYAADEDDAVLNPQLKNHLIRLGIDVNILKKTEKSTAELQVSDKRDCLLFVVFSIGRRCN